MTSYDLKQGDCLELMNDIPDKSVDLICCDPPYGTTSIKWDEVLDFDKMWVVINDVLRYARML